MGLRPQLLVLALLLFSSWLPGSLSANDEIIPFVLLVGHDLSDQDTPCSLRVVDIQGDPFDSPFVLEIKIEHPDLSNDVSSTHFFIDQPIRKSILKGHLPGGQLQIRFGGDSETYRFRDIKSYIFNYWNENQKHRYTCVNLKYQ